MTDVAHGLYIKYGLQHRPTDNEVRQWRDQANHLIRLGHGAEQAGAVAAKDVFWDYNTMVYASEADTITALLRAAASK